MDRSEYRKVLYKHLPADMKQKYNLHTKVTSNNYIYICIKKEMYGLKQAAILADNNLNEDSNHLDVLLLPERSVFGHITQ